MSHFQEITCQIMYLTKFQESNWLSRWQFQRQFHKTQAISDSKLCRSWNISVIGQLRRDRILSQLKYRIWASLGGNFLFWVRFVVLFLVAKCKLLCWKIIVTDKPAERLNKMWIFIYCCYSRSTVLTNNSLEELKVVRNLRERHD